MLQSDTQNLEALSKWLSSDEARQIARYAWEMHKGDFEGAGMYASAAICMALAQELKSIGGPTPKPRRYEHT